MNGSARVKFTVSFIGAVWLGILTLWVGNSWVTVFERASIGFLVVFVVINVIILLIRSLAREEEQAKGALFDQTIPAEVPSFQEQTDSPPAEEDFIAWTFPPKEGSEMEQTSSQAGR